IDPGKVYFTPVIKCRDFEVTLTSKQLKNHASHWVIPELDSLPNVKYILALGNEALTATIGKSGITKYRGRTFTRGDAEVIATISPSAVNRNPGQKPGYLADLRLFANKVRGRKAGVKIPKY